VAVGVGLLVLVLLILGVKGCLNSRSKNANKDYVREVGGLTQQSDQQGKSLFDLLSSRGGRDRAVDVTNTLNAFRVQSAQLVDRARGLDVPGEMKTAQRYVVETLEFRRDGLAAIADALPTALGDQDRRRGTQIAAAQIRAFDASDVIYSQRASPAMESALKDKGIADEVAVPKSQFLPDIRWLDPSFFSDQVSRIRTGSGARAATPGLHGTGLASASLGGQALTPGGSVNITLSGNLQFQVQVQNQGQGTETDVAVRTTIGSGADAIDGNGRVDTIAAGETKTVAIPVQGQPPTGQTVPVTVSVEPVPGERKTDNNKQQYSAIFTR
jgi:hypothetical protein